MLTVHHLNNSRSQRVLWMLEELNLDYQIEFYQRDKKTMLAPASLKEVHPLGKSPVLTDKEHTIAESGAIIDYLARTYSNDAFRPPESSDQHQHYVYWLHFAEGSLMPQLLLKLVMQKVKDNAQPFFVKPIAGAIANKVNKNFIMPNITRQLAFIETHLKLNQWFAANRLTGADFQMSFPLEAAVHRGLCKNYPSITQWVEKVQARDAYKRALSKGGDYDFA